MIGIYSQSGQIAYGIKYYIVDTEAEKDNLSTKDKIGCKCYVIENKTWYILNGNGQYVPFVGEDSTADAILNSIKNMSADQKEELKEELDISGGGGEVTPASVALAINNMTDEQAAQALADLGYTVDSSLDDESENPVQNAVIAGRLAFITLALAQKAIKATVVDVSGTTPTITPEDNHEYKCGTLDSLTISTPPPQGIYSIVFTSGATATTTVIPATVLGLESFAPEANTLYEINVLDNRAVVGSWAVSST